ncbi:MAG TPA: diacylglycerol kinase family lipid kinase [Kouleothrix sp.]|uniref:diacylglycerol/lipid kinase family protein n=1 Tax=Kouleothrix sp. TaxID=2779161 RepID=UPI002D1E029E|nr:diacylglycerol kinase family lipid kinase [Kouleothrix sp.]HRC74583.1 diacylglycerol kinase family lipid kinase [Kouleothrix sp.]
MTKLLIILNPWAGRGTAGRRRPEIEAALRESGADYSVLTTHARGGATELAWQGVEHGYDRIVAIGGDGTINEVVNGIKGAEANLGRRARLGIIPLGTGSDFIKVLDGFEANDIAGGVRRAVGDRARPIDLGRAQVGDDQPRYFINALGMGFDAQAAAEALKLTKLKGLAVYLVAIIRALANYKAHPMTVEYDGSRVHRRLLFASVANGRCQGGGFWLTPEALIDDGLLDLCLVDNLRIDQIVRRLPRVMEGTHTQLREVTMGRARSITTLCPAGMPVATDGEVIATDARQVTVETLPAAIEVLG